MFWLMIKTDRRLDGVEEFLGIVASKFETVSLLRGRIVRSDGVVQPAGGTHHGDRPIFEAINLIQTTRLIFRRHEEEICPGFDLMS